MEALKASARDLVLAFVAAFVGAFVMPSDVSLPAVKAAVIAAGYAGVRAVIGLISAKIVARRAG